MTDTQNINRLDRLRAMVELEVIAVVNPSRLEPFVRQHEDRLEALRNEASARELPPEPEGGSGG